MLIRYVGGAVAAGLLSVSAVHSAAAEVVVRGSVWVRPVVPPYVPPVRVVAPVVWVRPLPPPVVVAVPPLARVGWVWAPGYWRWAGGHYAWIEGAWQPAR